jgi:hypothetical protein
MELQFARSPSNLRAAVESGVVPTCIGHYSHEIVDLADETTPFGVR